MQEHRQNSYIASIGCFVCSIMVVAFCAVSALPDHGFSLAISQYAAVLALSALLLFSPALVSIPLQRKYGMVWYCSEGVATLLLLFCAFVLGALGLPIGRFLLIGLGTLAGLVMLARGLTEKLPLPALGVVSVIGSLFFVLVFYSQGYHSPLFSEKVMLGQAHIDTLFHAAIANLFGTYHEITTGLHFHPQLKYHAGSHVLFWGLSRLTGLHPVDFYNVAYPAIFLPLYLKSLFLFAIAYARKLGTNTFSLTFLLLVLVVCYSTGYSRLGLMDPLVSESNAVALTLIFLYLSSLLSLAPRPVSPRNATAFLAFSFSVILWATFTKVSVGFIFIGAVTYLLLRVSNFRPKVILTVLVGLLVWGAVVWSYVYGVSPGVAKQGLVLRYLNFWAYSGGFLGYSLGMFLAIGILLFREEVNSFADVGRILRQRKHLDLELLLLATVLGLVGGVAASAGGSDVSYFAFPQFHVSLVVLGVTLAPLWNRMRLPAKTKIIAASLVMLLAVFSAPSIVRSLYSLRALRREYVDSRADRSLLGTLIGQLRDLSQAPDKSLKCIYIPPDQNWYYESQSYRKFGSHFIVPAFSGIAMISGVPKMASDQTSYSFSLYRHTPVVGSVQEAQKCAADAGYRELIVFREQDGELISERFNL